MNRAIVFVLVLIMVCFSFLAYYSSEKFTARVTTVLTVVERFQANCSFRLFSGWNLLGLSCKPDNADVNSLINASNNSIISIHTYDGDDPADSWKAFKPGLPGWVIQDLRYLDRRHGYWILSNSTVTVDFNGVVVLPTVNGLVPGWHLLGYPNVDKRNISETLASLNNSYQIVYLFNNTAKNWLLYNPAEAWGTQTLKWLKAHDAFWIHLNKSEIWYYE